MSNSAGATELELSLSSSLSYGDPVILELAIVNPESAVSPTRKTLPPVDGLTIAGPSRPSYERRIVNGRTTVKRTYRYRLTPEAGRTGTFTIGPARIERPGKPPLESNTMELAVYRRPELGVRFRGELSAAEGIVGVPFRVVYTLSAPQGAPRAMPEVSFPVRELSGAVATSVKARPRLPAHSWEELVVQETVLVHPDKSAERALLFAFEVVPMKTGKLTLPAASASWELATGGTEVVRSLFGSRRVSEVRAFRAETEPLVYTVAPLPPRAPPGFTGAVGSYEVTVATEDTEVNAFDPIELTITVKGRGLLEELPVPAWKEVPELAKDFEVSSDVDAGEVREGAKVFRQVIRPLHERVTEIPPIPFPHYDPWKKEYVVARAEPIPIRVHAVKTVGPEETIGRPAGARVERPASPPTVLERGGVTANFRDPGSPAPFLTARSIVLGLPFLAVLGAPPALFALLLVARRRADRSPEERSREHAFRRVHRTLSSAPDHETVASAYQGYFRDRFGLPPGELTPADIERLEVAGIPRDVRDRARRHLEELLAVRFGGSARPPGELAARAEEIIREVERCGPL